MLSPNCSDTRGSCKGSRKQYPCGSSPSNFSLPPLTHSPSQKELPRMSHHSGPTVHEIQILRTSTGYRTYRYSTRYAWNWARTYPAALACIEVAAQAMQDGRMSGPRYWVYEAGTYYTRQVWRRCALKCVATGIPPRVLLSIVEP